MVANVESGVQQSQFRMPCTKFDYEDKYAAGFFLFIQLSTSIGQILQNYPKKRQFCKTFTNQQQPHGK